MTPTGRRCAALAGRGSCLLPETSRFVSRKRLITMWYLDAFVVLFYVVKISSLASALVYKCSCIIDIHHIHVA